MVLGYPHLVRIDKSMFAPPRVLRTWEYVFLVSSLGFMGGNQLPHSFQWGSQGWALDRLTRHGP
jgi:hypothetical protein